MSKPYLFLDFDGLQFATLGPHTEYVNKKYGVNMTIDDIRNDVMLEAIQKLRPELGLTFYSFFSDIGENFQTSMEWHKNVMPVTSAEEIIPLLARKFTLWTVTARQEITMHVMKYLSEKYFPSCISMYHCAYKDSGKGYFDRISKKDFLQNFKGGENVFIDDTPREVQSVQDILRAYLFDMDDFHISKGGILNRVNSWYKIADILL